MCFITVVCMSLIQSPVWGCVVALIIAPDTNSQQNPSRTSSEFRSVLHIVEVSKSATETVKFKSPL